MTGGIHIYAVGVVVVVVVVDVVDLMSLRNRFVRGRAELTCICTVKVGYFIGK